MKITLEFLQANDACIEGIEFAQTHELIGLDDIDFIKKLIKLKKLAWANWLTGRIVHDIKKVRYAVYAAEQVIDIFEKKYPNDDRPRKAINVAKRYIANPTMRNARAADVAAYAASYAAYAAANAVFATSYTGDAATHAADAAVNAAYAAHTAHYVAPYAALAGDAAYTAVYLAFNTAQAAYGTMLKIVNYGIELLKEV